MTAAISMLVAVGAAWTPHASLAIRSQRLGASFLLPARQVRLPQIACLVTEDDVEVAVEQAEKLWAQALEARQRADKLSGDAESLAEEVCRLPSFHLK